MIFNIFKTKEEREKEEKAYRKKLLPFGEEQQQIEQELVRSCFRQPEKYDISELYYQLICVKDILLDEVESEKDQKAQAEALKQWNNGRLQKRFTQEERDRVVDLARRILAAGSLEEIKGL